MHAAPSCHLPRHIQSWYDAQLAWTCACRRALSQGKFDALASDKPAGSGAAAALMLVYLMQPQLFGVSLAAIACAAWAAPLIDSSAAACVTSSHRLLAAAHLDAIGRACGSRASPRRFAAQLPGAAAGLATAATNMLLYAEPGSHKLSERQIACVATAFTC